MRGKFYISIELVPREPTPLGELVNDQRLEARHWLCIDRQTHLPKRWWMKSQFDERETACIYSRFDVDPPPCELKVSLTGYRELRSQVPLDKFQTTAPQPPAKPSALEVTARVLWWLLF
jgi:hypothetical protein